MELHLDYDITIKNCENKKFCRRFSRAYVNICIADIYSVVY